MKKLFLPLLVFVLSCETVVTPQLPDDPEQLVVYSFFRPGEPIRFDVFKTTPIMGSPGAQPQHGLTISLYADNQPIETIQQNSNKKYLSTSLAQAGKTYRFEVVSPYGTASGESTIPEAVEIQKATFDSEIQDINLGEYGFPASITFSDPGAMENYYALEVFVNQCQENCDESEALGRLNEILMEEVKVNTSGNTNITISDKPADVEGQRYIYLSDMGFDGKQITIDFYIVPSLIDPESLSETKIQYVLKSITADYYEYLLTSDYQQQIQEEGTLVEPVQIYTNIHNGLGAFAGYSITKYEINSEQ